MPLILALITLTYSLLADTPRVVNELAPDLLRLHESMLLDHTCEASWVDLFAAAGSSEWNIDSYTRLHVVPCSHWSDNTSYKVYAEFAEPQPGGHGMFVRMDLPTVEIDQTQTARDEIYAWSWEAPSNQIISIYKMRGRPDCGVRMVYGWDAAKLRFNLARVFLKARCDGRLEVWPELRDFTPAE